MKNYIGKIAFQASPGKKKKQDPNSKITRAERIGGMA
jgi:hypothetical protein